MKHKTTEIVDATIQMYADLQEIAGLISRVLAKFPAETVPQVLRPFLGSPRVAFARPSMTGDGKIMLQLDRRTQPYVMAWIPGEWLRMQESQLTAAVREMYWSEKAHRAEPVLPGGVAAGLAVWGVPGTGSAGHRGLPRPSFGRQRQQDTAGPRQRHGWTHGHGG
ncbi:hypothetical protein [Streptomyces halobius]|uniref:Uncharacterized protein n=1 Tax=Streptomyces halobius TaxID=2879846 RepID=A0ABY4M0K0_9ACTN|nr:hypothetical protein [Streptomyces halobius]UQA91260.1 hypothetical protein K9S39_04645 [Streptomyces halobius]